MENPIPVTDVPASVSPINEKPKNGFLKEILIVVILLVVGAGISYGSYWGYTTYQSKQVTLGKVVSNIIGHIRNNDIKSVEIGSTIKATMTGTNVASSTSSNPYTQAISQINNISTNIAFNGILDNTDKDNFKTYGKLSLTITVDGKSGSFYSSLSDAGPLTVEVEYYVFPDALYFKINKVPPFVGMYAGMMGINASSYLNEWILVDQKYIDAFKTGFTKGMKGKSLSVDMTDEQYSELQKAITQFYDVSGAIRISDRKSETTPEGKAVTALYLTVDNDKLLAGAAQFAQDLARIFPDAFANVDKTKSVDNADFMKTMKSLSLTDFKVLVGSDGYPYGNSGTVTIPASDTAPAIVESVDSSFKNYNKEFNLTKPTDAKDVTLILMEMQAAAQKNSMKAAVLKK